MSMGYYLSDESGECHDCGESTYRVDRCHGYRLCDVCSKRRDRAYDDYVDPEHWYHQHSPERTCEA